jgi:FkbM family methyltransferase
MSTLHELRRRLMQQPRLRAVVDAARLMRRYGTPHPTSVRLRHSGNTLFVNPREARGKAVLLCFANGQPCVKNAWHTAIEKLQPTIVVDIGVNYGELLFDARYAPETFVLGVEANESLRPWIERSRSQHPNSQQIRLAFAFASNELQATHTFYIDPESSGRGSGIAREGKTNLIPVQVPTVTIDSFVAERADEDLASQRLLFKIDVEGYEPFVVGGMSRLLRCCRQKVGILEFNTNLMRTAGIDAQQYMKTLASHFPVAFARQAEEFRPFPWATAVDEIANGKKYVTDLLLISDQTLASKMGLSGV